MDLKINAAPQPTDLQSLRKPQTLPTEAQPPAHPTAAGITDHAPALGKQATALDTVNLLEEPQTLSDIIAQALQELQQSSGNPWEKNAGSLKPFAEREAEMTRNLMAKMNHKVFNEQKKSWNYACSNQEIEAQIKQLKQEAKNIARQREMGVTDCWGGLTNRQVACEAAIRALESCLKQRSLTQAARTTEPQIQICGPFPWEEKFQELKRKP